MSATGIYGFGSGLDVPSMVNVEMMPKKKELDRMEQKKLLLEYKKEDFLEVASKITTSSATFSQYKMTNTMNAKTAESSNSAVKVSVNSTAALMSHKVEVGKLSSNAYLVGTNSMTRYDTTTGDALSNSSSIKLADVLFKKITTSTNADGDKIVSGNIAAVSAKSKDAAWIADGSTTNFKDGFNLTEAHSFGEAYTGDTSYTGLKTSETAFEFKIYDGTEDWDSMTADEKTAYENAHTIKYTYDELLGENGATFNDLVSKINSLGLNIKASYDSVNDRFSFYNSKGGEDNNVQIVLGTAGGKDTSRSAVATRNFFNNMGLYQSANGTLTGENNVAATVDDGKSMLFEIEANVRTGTNSDGTAIYSSTTGQNAFKGSNGEITVDGVKYTNVTDNKITISGVTYTALNTTESTGASTVSVSQDTDSIIEKVKSFVSEYNALLADLYKKYDEKPNSDYKPLTQSQKDEMTEEQIKKWEEKAKAGHLYHDQTIGKIIMNMRSAITQSVEGVDGKYNSIFSLGVSTTGLKGQLVLNEDKLKKALSEDPDSVYNVFGKLDSKDLNNSAKSGVAQRLGDIFNDAKKSIKSEAGSSSDVTEDSTINNSLRRWLTKISSFKKQMTTWENALYKKHDAMEAMIGQLNMQLGMLFNGQQ